MAPTGVSADPSARKGSCFDFPMGSPGQRYDWRNAELAQVFDPDETLAHVGLTNRSVFEILRFASGSVDVPERDTASGRVRMRDIDVSEYLNVLTSATEPSNAWLKVQYRGAWYFIPGTDLNSRTSFTLLSALFSSVVGKVPGAKPVLTPPVN